MRAAKKIATIKLFMYVCPIARMKKSEGQVNDFHKISYLGFYRKFAERFQFLLNRQKIRNFKGLPG
jgi:hypothetical protein